MPRSGPRAVRKYSDEFKLTAVRLSQQPGLLGVHWELWSIASGGMPTHDVLRVGTIFGAEAIGVAKDLGSLEPGKLADLQVLERNPLENIRNTNTLRYVMKNGRLYDANTLREIAPRAKPLDRMWWLAAQ